MKLLKIADLCESVNVGFVGPSTRERDVEGVPFLMGKNIGPGYLKLKSLDRVRKDFHLKNRKSQLKAGDIVVVRIGNSGQAVQIPEEFGEANCAGLIIIKKPNSLINPNYLVYYLNSPQGRAYSLSKATGTTRQTLNTKTVAETLVPIPSVEKQNEIVEKLDSAFAEIELLERNLGLSEEKANQLTQSLLGSEFSLNSDENLNNPSAPQGKDIKVLPLKDFCKMYQPPTISIKEMIPDGKFIVFGANGPIGRYNKFNHEEPQLLVTCRGATCGAVNMSEPFSWINGNAMVIQPDLEMASLKYMKYAFLGGIDVSSSITGSAQPQITRTTLEVIKVPLPTLEKQSEIVEKLDSAFAEIDLFKMQIRKEKTMPLPFASHY